MISKSYKFIIMSNTYLKKACNPFVLLFITIFPVIVYSQVNYKVIDIDFEGNNTISASRLSENMIVNGTGTFSRIILRKDPFLFNSKVLQDDLKRIKKLYQSEGFLNVNINHELLTKHDDKTVDIQIHITENDPVVVDTVQFQFKNNTKTAEQILAKIHSKLRLQKGDRFRDQALRDDETLLVNAFNNEGFPYISVSSDLKFHRESFSVVIIYNLNTGPLSSFGNITVTKNKRTPGAVIKKQLAFKKNDIFNESLIEKSQIQVYQLGFFQSVSIQYSLPKEKVNSIPIQVTVKEAPRLTTKFGVGYGREDNFRVFTDITRLGFLGGARRLNLYIKHSGLEPYNVNLKFTQPAFLSPRTSFHLESFVRKEHEPGYKLQRIGTSPALQHIFSSKTNGYFGYNLEQIDQEISEATVEKSFQRLAYNLYNKSSIKMGIIRDSSHPKFTPQQGTFAALNYMFSGLGFNSKYHFMKLIMEFRHYREIDNEVVFASKIKVGSMKPWREGEAQITPLEERFFAGGSMSVRGWARSQLGPQNKEGDPVGGNSILESSLELRFPIWKIISGATFLDIGNVWTKSLTYPFNDLYYALGAGIRISTPIGPIRFDIGRPVFREVRDYQIHLNVGQAF